jgi:hypothetical protein
MKSMKNPIRKKNLTINLLLKPNESAKKIRGSLDRYEASPGPRMVQAPKSH